MLILRFLCFWWLDGVGVTKKDLEVLGMCDAYIDMTIIFKKPIWSFTALGEMVRTKSTIIIAGPPPCIESTVLIQTLKIPRSNKASLAPALIS